MPRFSAASSSAQPPPIPRRGRFAGRRGGLVVAGAGRAQAERKAARPSVPARRRLGRSVARRLRDLDAARAQAARRRRHAGRGGRSRLAGRRGRGDDEGRRNAARPSPPPTGRTRCTSKSTASQPDRWYWYQFKAAGDTSPVGRTRTLPPAGATPDRLRFAFASCQHFETGLFTAYEHMAKDDLDLVVHLGDYIYEGSRPRQTTSASTSGRS